MGIRKFCLDFPCFRPVLGIRTVKRRIRKKPGDGTVDRTGLRREATRIAARLMSSARHPFANRIALWRRFYPQ
jgi:hypothetical protein